MITEKNKEVVTTVLFLVGFAFLVFCSVLSDYKKIDIVYFIILIIFIVRYVLCFRNK